MITIDSFPKVNDVMTVDLGIVTNDGTDFNTAEENDIIIEFSAYVMDPSDTVFDQPIKIFADIMWNNSTWMVIEKEFIIRSQSVCHENVSERKTVI